MLTVYSGSVPVNQVQVIGSMLALAELVTIASMLMVQLVVSQSSVMYVLFHHSLLMRTLLSFLEVGSKLTGNRLFAASLIIDLATGEWTPFS
jgi:hypothetical protein